MTKAAIISAVPPLMLRTEANPGGLPREVLDGFQAQLAVNRAPLSAELLQNGTLETYAGFPHGMPTTQAETINADLLAFIRG